MIWHSSEINDVLTQLEVDEKKGLTNGVVDIRTEIYGKNTIKNIDKPNFKKHFLGQLKSKLVISLIIIAILSFAVSLIYGDKDFYYPLFIIAIVIINSLVSAWHLYRCDDALNSLKSITNPSATVIRDGITRQIPSADLVPGDIIILNEGDFITADARIIETSNFRCNESVLTGENIPVDKRANVTFEEITPINERLNMVYSGCNVVHGSCKAVVVETGLNTEIGHNATMIQQTGADTIPIKATLDSTAKLANIAIIVVCLITFIIAMIQNFKSDMSFANLTAKLILNSVALAVAAIPEGLPAISTIVVALGIQRIIEDNIIIKKVTALEVLGKTTVICSDKTGIITHNHMSLNRVYDGERIIDVENEPFSEKTAILLRMAVSCSTLTNDSTEESIIDACYKYTSLSKSDIENLYPRLETIPFDNERKTMTSINMINGKPVAIVKGAPEALADKFINISAEELLKANEELAGDALRVICIGLKPLYEFVTNPSPEDIECNLTFAGLIGLYDPPRSDTIEGIASCDTAGIRTIMITGDNIITAKAVARRIGILKDGTEAITGAELSELSDEELAENITKYSVYARVTPSDKLRIIDAWHKNGDIVTITGDDITDADALACADIGCAMNMQGADVAKGNADIIISDNNFISIVNAIKESRGLFANIQKSVFYLFSCNIAELLIYLIGMLIFGAPPLAAILLLWINLLTDCAPAISLSTERAEYNVMQEKPITLMGRLFDTYKIIQIALYSVFITIITLIAYAIGGMTLAFLTLALSQILHSFNVKTNRSIINVRLGINDFMTVSTILIIFIILFLALTPAGAVFGLSMLSIKHLLIGLVLSVSIIPFGEILKFSRRFIKK